MLIAISGPIGGVIVIGATSITYMQKLASGGMNLQAVVIQPSTICACTKIDRDGKRYLVADHRGVVSVLVLVTDEAHKVCWYYGAVTHTAITHDTLPCSIKLS
jgi:hypothetical protein